MTKPITLLTCLLLTAAHAEYAFQDPRPALKATTLDYAMGLPENTKATVTRTFTEGSNMFTIVYEYLPLGYSTIPATIPPGKSHYPAKVRVTLNGQPFGNEFDGEVVPDGGCFEDEPGAMVDKARHAPPPKTPEPPHVLGLTNGWSYTTNRIDFLTNLAVTNFGPNFQYFTNMEVYAVTNVNDTDSIYRYETNTLRGSVSLEKVDMRGVKKPADLCPLIGHVFTAGPGDKTVANEPERWRHCVLCGKREFLSGEWK